MDWIYGLEDLEEKRSSGTTRMEYKDEAHADLNLLKHLPRSFLVLKAFATSSSVRRFEAKVPEAANSNSAAVFII